MCEYCIAAVELGSSIKDIKNGHKEPIMPAGSSSDLRVGLCKAPLELVYSNAGVPTTSEKTRLATAKVSFKSRLYRKLKDTDFAAARF